MVSACECVRVCTHVSDTQRRGLWATAAAYRLRTSFLSRSAAQTLQRTPSLLCTDTAGGGGPGRCGERRAERWGAHLTLSLSVAARSKFFFLSHCQPLAQCGD